MRLLGLPLAMLIAHGGSLPAAEAPTHATSGLVRSSNAFGLDLYQRLKSNPGNLVFSPASVTTGLAMAWAGAKGATAAEMARVLHFDGTPDEVLKASGQLAAELSDPGQPIVFRIANRLFAERTSRLEPGFIQATNAAYGAALEPVDFEGAPEASRERINGWVEQQTEKRIRDLVPVSGVDSLTRLVLVNAIYFLGAWQLPFDEGATQRGRFFVSRKNRKDIPFMLQQSYFKFAERDRLKALELPYQGDSLSMLILLPERVDGLAAVEATLTADGLDAIVKSLSKREVSVALPKFEVNPTDSLALAENLKAMGMTAAFEQEKADFTGIANPPDPRARLYIKDVFHKAFVKVDEKGTEAAAATAVHQPTGAAWPPPKPRVFFANHPFLFFVRHIASGLVLFIGRVSDPAVK